MLVLPTLLREGMSSTSGMAPRCRSRGVATELAMTSGLAPGSDAVTKIAGASILGRGATGRSPKAAMPHKAAPNVNRIVATALRIRGPEMFTLDGPPARFLRLRVGNASPGDQRPGR